PMPARTESGRPSSRWDAAESPRAGLARKQRSWSGSRPPPAIRSMAGDPSGTRALAAAIRVHPVFQAPPARVRPIPAQPPKGAGPMRAENPALAAPAPATGALLQSGQPAAAPQVA